MKRKKIIIIIIILIAVIGSAYFVYAKGVFSSGFDILGWHLGNTLKDDKIVAKVNEEPVYLSEVALPYFSMNFSYLQAKESIEAMLNNPNTPESTKEELLKGKPLTPEEELQRIIGMKLLSQELEKEGMTIPEEQLNKELKELEDLHKYNLEHYPDSSWSKYYKEVLSVLGASDEECIEKYYHFREFQKMIDLCNKFSKTISAPEPTEEEIKEEMTKSNIVRETAIENCKSRYIHNIIDKKIEELKKSANIEIIDIEAVQNLSKIFE